MFTMDSATENIQNERNDVYMYYHAMLLLTVYNGGTSRLYDCLVKQLTYSKIVNPRIQLL